MITTSSKFFYALSGLLIVTGIAYGYSTGGGEVGPLSLGYKGAVGDVLGYTIVMGAAFLAAFIGFAVTAFRDADPDAGAELLGTETAPRPSAPGASYWPVIGSFGAGLTVVGVAVNNVFFVAGLIVLGAVALEWTIQAWAERATGDPAVNREIRNRIMLPVEIPVAGALAVGVVIVGFSRLFLAVSAFAAVWAALACAAIVFGLGTVLSSRPHLRTDVVAGVLAVGAVATIGIGITAALVGERDFEHHGEEHTEEEHSGSDSDTGDGGGSETESESGDEVDQPSDEPAEESN